MARMDPDDARQEIEEAQRGREIALAGGLVDAWGRLKVLCVILVAMTAGVGALLLWLLWPSSTTSSPSLHPPEEHVPAGLGPRLAGSPHQPREVVSPPAVHPGGDRLVECEIRVTTFGDVAREVLAQTLDRSDPPAPSVRLRTKPGEHIWLVLSGAAVPETGVEIPDPVPARLEVRVPARDDPRLADPVLLVVDERSGQPLPQAVLDPATAAPDSAPVPADAEGRIRVPRSLAERIRSHHGLSRSAIIVEPDHIPKGWASLVEMGRVSAADWSAWDVSGVMRVGLKPFPGDQPIPRRTFQFLGEDGKPRSGCLALVRTSGMEILGYPPVPGRADASGRVELVAPIVASYDVYDGATLVGTFVVSRDATAEGTPREFRIPAAVRVHVVVRGLGQPKPDVWLHGPDVISLESDDDTGWARIDGEVEPGWKAFARAEGGRVRVSETLPAEMDVSVPRGVSVPLDVAGRRAILLVEEATTVDLDWGLLPTIPRESGNVTWSATREGLDETPGVGPGAK